MKLTEIFDDTMQQLEQLYDQIIDNADKAVIETIERKNPIKRGISTDLDFWLGQLKHVRKDRQPTDIPSQHHEYLNYLFNQKFGINARKETVFATTAESKTKEFGETYIIFPVEPYTIIQPTSSKIADPYVYFGRKPRELFVLTGYEQQYDQILNANDNKQGQLDKLYKQAFYKLIVEMDIYETTTSLVEVGNNISEIMIDCDQYYILHAQAYNSFVEYYHSKVQGQ